MRQISTTPLYFLLLILLMLAPQLQAESISSKKQSFFKKIYPLIELENISILKTRNKIISARKKLDDNQKLSAAEKIWLTDLAKKYRLLKYSKDTDKLIDKLLIKIDVIPPSLAIAQSANESAWGKSRFARLANNYFGQWCFSKGCGIIPKRRSANSKHEVRKFSSVQASVRSYMKNINSTRPYAELRQMRYKLRLKNMEPDGLKLAQGLIRYSSRKQEYVNEIRAMIKYNKLIKYDQRFWNTVKEKKLDL